MQQPKIGEWYWFCHSSFKNGTSSPIVAKLRDIEYVNNTPRYTVYGITDEEYFNICELFTGDTPSFLKDKR